MINRKIAQTCMRSAQNVSPWLNPTSLFYIWIFIFTTKLAQWSKQYWRRPGSSFLVVLLIESCSKVIGLNNQMSLFFWKQEFCFRLWMKAKTFVASVSWIIYFSLISLFIPMADLAMTSVSDLFSSGSTLTLKVLSIPGKIKIAIYDNKACFISRLPGNYERSFCEDTLNRPRVYLKAYEETIVLRWG